MVVVGAPLKDSNSGEGYLFEIPVGHIHSSSSNGGENKDGLIAGCVVMSLVVICFIALYILRSVNLCVCFDTHL
jgi:hypothetical protein